MMEGFSKAAMMAIVTASKVNSSFGDMADEASRAFVLVVFLGGMVAIEKMDEQRWT